MFPLRLVVALGALSVSLLVVSCGSNPAATPAANVPADTWAVVNGRQIKQQDVDKAYNRVRDTSQALSDEEMLTAKLTLLNDIIVQDLLIAKAAELKIELTDKELDDAYAEARKNIPEDAFQQELTRRGLSPADMREGLRRELLTQKVMEREVAGKVNVSEQEIADFFNANKAQFNIPEESYHLAQIVVTPVRDQQIGNRTGDDATTPQAAAAKTQLIMQRLKSGTPFPELAADLSEDPDSAARGGDIGFVPVSRIRQAPPNMRDAVLGKTPGTVNVVSVNGAHTIVLVVAHEQPGQRDLSMPVVRDRITSGIRTRKEQLLRAAYLTNIRSEAAVENLLARRLVESQGKAPNLAPASPGAKPQS